jgi:hypothetical protein
MATTHHALCKRNHIEGRMTRQNDLFTISRTARRAEARQIAADRRRANRG